MPDNKNWVDRRVDREYQIRRDSLGLWSELCLSVEDVLESYTKRCSQNPLKVRSYKHINGSAYQVAFENRGSSHDTGPILELKFSDGTCSVAFKWSASEFGPEGSFSIQMTNRGETALFYKDEECSADRASEIVLAHALFPEKRAIG